MKKLNKKGFTIVELVIVIAVIAILAAVLIPTFSGVVDKANNSAALQTARSTLTCALNMSSNAQLAGKKGNDYQTVIVVDGGYAFGYDGNEIKAMDLPGYGKTSKKFDDATSKLKKDTNYNAILISAQNLVDGAGKNATETEFATSGSYTIKNVADAIKNVSQANPLGASVQKLKDANGNEHYYLGLSFKNLTEYNASATYYTDNTGATVAKDVTSQNYQTYFVAESQAEVFINSDFAKNVVVFTTFSK